MTLVFPGKRPASGNFSGKVTHKKFERRQRRASGGHGKDGWREVRIGLRGWRLHIVLEAWRDECGVKVHARVQRRRRMKGKGDPWGISDGV